MEPTTGDGVQEVASKDNRPTTICSEVFTDTLTGYPKYEVGFKFIDCDNVAPIYDQVTVLFNFVGYDFGRGQNSMLGEEKEQGNLI